MLYGDGVEPYGFSFFTEAKISPTYRTGGSPEAVTSETGWVVEQGDVKDVTSIVMSLEIRDIIEIAAQRAACRTRAEQEFGKDKCFEKYVGLYEELIKKNGNRSNRLL